MTASWWDDGELIADNASVPVLLLGPLIAVLGVVAVAAVIRTRWRVRHSLYETLRNERHRQIEEARARALGTTPASAAESPRVVESKGSLEVRETPLQIVLGYIALVVALLVVLLGVIVLVGGAR